MKNIILLMGVLFWSLLGIGQVTLTFTNQADLDAYNFQGGVYYDVTLANDITQPVNLQINNLQSMNPIDSVLSLEVRNTLITDLSGLENLPWFGSLSMEGNKEMDTLFLRKSILKMGSLWLEKTHLQYVHGLDSLTGLGRVFISDNDNLKAVKLGLYQLEYETIGSVLEVRLNDSLKTFYWGDLNRQLSAFSFFENRQLKHVHIETVKEKVSSISEPQGGFVFNIELDSISGFVGLDSVHSMFIKQNYMLENACVLQKGIDNYLTDYPQLQHFFVTQSNGSNLQSLNDLLTEDCSWLPNGIKEPLWSKLEIYPNPAHSEVYVTPTAQATSYFIFDISGKLVNQGTVTSNGRISLETISNGMYVLLVGNKRSKLIVQ